jgi:hypothetical protein
MPTSAPRPTTALHLAEFQLDRRGATKNRHRHQKPGALLIDLLNDAKEGGEGTIRDTDLVTYLEGIIRRPLEVVHGKENLTVYVVLGRKSQFEAKQFA